MPPNFWFLLPPQVPTPSIWERVGMIFLVYFWGWFSFGNLNLTEKDWSFDVCWCSFFDFWEWKQSVHEDGWEKKQVTVSELASPAWLTKWARLGLDIFELVHAQVKHSQPRVGLGPDTILWSKVGLDRVQIISCTSSYQPIRTGIGPHQYNILKISVPLWLGPKYRSTSANIFKMLINIGPSIGRYFQLGTFFFNLLSPISSFPNTYRAT